MLTPCVSFKTCDGMHPSERDWRLSVAVHLEQFSNALHAPRLTPPSPPFARGDKGGSFECLRITPGSSSSRWKAALLASMPLVSMSGLPPSPDIRPTQGVAYAIGQHAACEVTLAEVIVGAALQEIRGDLVRSDTRDGDDRHHMIAATQFLQAIQAVALLEMVIEDDELHATVVEYVEGDILGIGVESLEAKSSILAR